MYTFLLTMIVFVNVGERILSQQHVIPQAPATSLSLPQQSQELYPEAVTTTKSATSLLLPISNNMNKDNIVVSLSSAAQELLSTIGCLTFQYKPQHSSFQMKWNDCLQKCGAYHLNTASVGERSKCCMGGSAMHNGLALTPLHPTIKRICIDNLEKFSPVSSSAMNILAYGATTVKNDHGGGFEKGPYNGPCCVKVNGTIAEFIPKVYTDAVPGRATGALHYILLDQASAMADHVDYVNNLSSASKHSKVRQQNETEASDPDLPVTQQSPRVPKLDFNDIMALYDTLKEINPIAKELDELQELCEPFVSDDDIMPKVIVQTVDNNASSQKTKNNELSSGVVTKETLMFHVEVATITDERDGGGPKKITVKLKHASQGSQQNIANSDYRADLYAFPLFYPDGKGAFGKIFLGGENISNVLDKFRPIIEPTKRISAYDYYCCRMLMGEKVGQACPNKDGGEFLQVPLASNPTQTVRINRFQAMGRANGAYLCTIVNRMISERLEWVKDHQNIVTKGGYSTSSTSGKVNEATRFTNDTKKLTTKMLLTDIKSRKGTTSNNVTHLKKRRVDNVGSFDATKSESSELGGGKKSKTYLPTSVHGGRSQLRKLARDALTIVSERGRPSFFITLTANINWPEIADMLPRGQTAFDRPDIVCRVFHAKLEQFLIHLRKGSYFGGSKPMYLIRVIEYQLRGLPHAHVVVKMEDGPPDTVRTYEVLSEFVKYIDTHVFACLPPRAQHEELHHLIQSHMIHTCSTAPNGCKKSATDDCKRGFSTTTVQTSSSIDPERPYPKYRRLTKDDLHVVTYNPQILMDFKGHVNVEFAGSSHCVLYLFKYLYKGRNKVSAVAKKRSDEKTLDSIDLFIRGNYLCSMDACWRLLGYQTYPAPDPAVVVINVSTPQQVCNNVCLHDRCAYPPFI